MTKDELQNLRRELEFYIAENFIDEKKRHHEDNVQYAFAPDFSAALMMKVDFREMYNKSRRETFSKMLLRLIAESGEKNSTIYARANVNRQHFSKIVHNENYRTTRETALAFAIALKLDFDRTQDFLSTAGYTLTDSNLGDVIVKFFIKREMFDLEVINLCLDEHEQPLLGGGKKFSVKD